MPYVREWQEWTQVNEGTDAAIQELYQNPSLDGKILDITSWTRAYYNYKMEYVKHLSFNPKGEILGKFVLFLDDWAHAPLSLDGKVIPATMLEHAPLEAVYIYFDTASYDQIERDEKVIVQATHSHCMFKKN